MGKPRIISDNTSYEKKNPSNGFIIFFVWFYLYLTAVLMFLAYGIG